MSRPVRRPFAFLIPAVVAVAFVTGSHGAAASPSTQTSTRPNILLIIADDIGWNDYSFNHHPTIQTPNIDALARDGVVFNNGYSSNSICRPSLASIITGLYPYQHGITTNARALNKQRGTYEFGLPPFAKRMDSLDTLPRELAKLGYRSYQAGKWWEEGFANGGFDDGDKKPQGLFRHVTRMNIIGREGLQPLFDFIDNNTQQPFFIWYAPQLPHTPHNPPERFLAPYLKKTGDKTSSLPLAKYWGMVSWFDDTIGQIIAHLREHGLLDNTLVIYLADNGVDESSSNGEYSEGKDSPYEMGIRTPIIFDWPAQWKHAGPDSLLSNVDIFPTVLAVLHAPPVSGLPGKSALPAFRDETFIVRDNAVGESYVDEGKETFDNPRKFCWIRRDDGEHRWKLVRYRDGKTELFDLAQDAGEKHDLSGDTALQTVKNSLLQTLNQTLPEVRP